jgi:Domain of unknown function (DUF5666)
MKRPSFPGSRTALLLLVLTLPALVACSNEPTAAAPTLLPPALPSTTTAPTSEPTLPSATMVPTSQPTLPTPTGAPTEAPTGQPGPTSDGNATEKKETHTSADDSGQPRLERDGNTTSTALPLDQPTPTLPPRAPDNTGDAPQPPALTGVVERIDGQTLVIKPMRGASVTVQLSADTTLQMAVDIQPPEIQVGDSLTAVGRKNGEILAARQILIGQAAMLGRASQGGAPLQKGGAQVQLELSVSGTVEQIAGDTIRLQAQDGSRLTVQLTTETQVQKMQDIQASEIQVGAMAIVFGSQSGDVIQATRVEILSGRR